MSEKETILSPEESAVFTWKMKKLIETLQKCRGNGTSMISLIIPPRDQIFNATKMLTEEYGKASNIKSRLVRLAVQDALTSTQQRLKLFTKVPPNGLVIYCGSVIGEDGKEKRVTYDLEPFRKLQCSLYMCDNKFHVEPLMSLLESDEKYGFIIMDGNGCLYGTLTGSTKEILHKFGVELPKKHGRGGQSSLRFARIRLERRHNYLRKCAENATPLFITNDRPNVSGLIIAGSADFKTDLAKSDLFDQRLAAVILKIVDVAYGGENGFNQAIELAKDCLQNVKFLREKKLLDIFLCEIAMDTGKYVFGVGDTIKAMENGAVQKLIVWEELPHMRYTLTHPTTGEKKYLHMTTEQAKESKSFVDKDGVAYEVEEIQLLEWLADNYTTFGCSMDFVTNKSQEGAQFCRGFGGMGGLLRYRVDFDQNFENLKLAEDSEEDEDRIIHGDDDLSEFM
jgi:peptide chain release factor subunit 1